MGSYLNPGNLSFRGSLRSKIYVDKSELIARTNEALCTEQKYICVSRPRRFGKSMAANMLAAYYDRSEDAAEGAIRQIREKHYTDALKEYHGNLLLVGINYEKDTKTHTCVIEQTNIE